MGRKRIKHLIIDEVEHKRCSNCKEWLTLSNFNKHKGLWDGLQGCCKKCSAKVKKKWRQSEGGKKVQKKAQRKYQKTKKYKDYRKKYHKSEEFKKSHRKYRKTKKYKKVQKKYCQSKKGKKVRRKYLKEYYSKPEIKNKNNVRAKTKQYLVSASNYPCMMCNKQAEHFHHFTYDKHFKKNTVTLCESCHLKLHGKEAI